MCYLLIQQVWQPTNFAYYHQLQFVVVVVKSQQLNNILPHTGGPASYNILLWFGTYSHVFFFLSSHCIHTRFYFIFTPNFFKRNISVCFGMIVFAFFLQYCRKIVVSFSLTVFFFALTLYFIISISSSLIS